MSDCEDHREIEAAFSALLEKGCPVEASEVRVRRFDGLAGLLGQILLRIAMQLVNSEVPTTRDFWRERYPSLVTDAAHER